MLVCNGNKPSSEFTATPAKYPQKQFFKKPCRMCSTEFMPIAPSHLYCSDHCKDQAYEKRYFRINYGVEPKIAYDMLDNQDHLCAICRREGFKMNPKAYSKLVLDHDHKTGDPRGMLCHNCNRGLGLFQDDIGFLKSAIKYLEGATTISKESTLK